MPDHDRIGELKLDDIREPGPGFVPFFQGLTLAVLSIIAFIFPDPQRRWRLLERLAQGRGSSAIFAGLVVICLLPKFSAFTSTHSC